MLEVSSKKILYVIPSLSFGGAEHETIDQINYLYEKKYNVFLVVFSNDIKLFDTVNLPEERISILNIKGLTTTKAVNFKWFPLALKRLHKFIQEKEIDVVISVLPLSHLILRLHKTFYKTNYKLWCFHKSMQYEATPINTLPKKVVFKLYKVLSRKYDDGHIFISKAVKNNISSFLDIKNGHVVLNAVPLKKQKGTLALKYLNDNNIKEPEYLVVVPGRLHKTKGHIFFIESLKEYILKQMDAQLKIVFVGGGPLLSEIQFKIEQEGLSNHVIITDYVKNPLMLSFISLANLVVIPSIHEGFGNVAIESLMQGTTVLVSNTGGLPEIIKDGYNGYVFEKLNKTELNKKFILLHKQRASINPELLQNDFKERFTIEAQMQKIINLIS